MKSSKTKKRKSKVVRPSENGTNIRAPRTFEDGEVVFFIQKIYGLSVCFGQGVITEATDLPSGYDKSKQQGRLQYVIKGSRVFYHEGRRLEETGSFKTWLGASTIVIVPRNIRTSLWFKECIQKWRAILSLHEEALQFMRFK